MTVPFQASGVWTALVTPFTKAGAVDDDALKRLVDFQVSEGIDGVLPCGTTGESPTLSWQEHDDVIDRVVDTVGERVGVLAGTGSNNTHEAVRGTDHARKVGASAALIVDCYYNGPSSLELRTEYYERILNSVPEIPLVPYIIPSRCGCELSAVDLALLHSEWGERVPAVKSATGDFDRMRLDRELAGSTFTIMSGDDDLTLAMMRDPQIACTGVISVMSNIVPGALGRMVRAQREGDTAAADEIASAIAPLFGLVGCNVESTRVLPDGRSVSVTDKFRNPTPVKAMMAGLGMVGSTIRKPLGKMNAAGVQRSRQALIDVLHADAEVLAPIGRAYEVDIESRLHDDAVWAALCR